VLFVFNVSRFVFLRATIPKHEIINLKHLFKHEALNLKHETSTKFKALKLDTEFV